MPTRDAARLAREPGVRLIRGIETRVIMLGFDQASERPVSGDGPNPFRDMAVRRVVARAVNRPAIIQTILRGNAEPAAQRVPRGIRGSSQAWGERPGHDPGAARALLAGAGYPGRFAFDLKCPNDRYLNDAAVCRAVVSMPAQVGPTPTLDAMPVRNHWPEPRADSFDMVLPGWSPGTFDTDHPLRFLAHRPADSLGRRISAAIPMRASTRFCC